MALEELLRRMNPVGTAVGKAKIAQAGQQEAEAGVATRLAGLKGIRDESRIKAEKASFDYSSAKTEKDMALVDMEDKLKRYRLENDTLKERVKATVGQEEYDNYMAGKPLRDKETELDAEETKRKVDVLDKAIPELEKRFAVADLWENFKFFVPAAAIDDFVRTGWDYVTGDNTQKVYKLGIMAEKKFKGPQRARKQAEGLIQ